MGDVIVVDISSTIKICSPLNITDKSSLYCNFTDEQIVIMSHFGKKIHKIKLLLCIYKKIKNIKILVEEYKTIKSFICFVVKTNNTTIIDEKTIFIDSLLDSVLEQLYTI